METKNLNLSLSYILFSLLPISIVIGSSVSLINVVFLNILFLITYFKKKINFSENKNILTLLGSLYLYLIINSFLGIDFENSYKRGFGFIRFLLLFLAINYLFLNYKKNLFKIWIAFLGLLVFDCYVESILGYNIFGWTPIYQNRIVSFFKDEPVVGTFIFSFYMIISAEILSYKIKNNKIYFLFFVLLSIIIIFLSGERSVFIKSFIAIILFFILSKDFSTKNIIYILTILIVALAIIFSASETLKKRYVTTFFNKIIKNGKIDLVNNEYFPIYKSGYHVFAENKIFGVGTKNYGKYVTQKINEKENSDYSKFISTTHPHQIYLEFLSEHGLFGAISILLILFILFFRMLKIIIQNRNNIQIACFSFLITYFIPLLPSGSFFSDFNSNLFWINFSIFFAISDKTNIFKIK